jgi:hypothetical protein
MDITPVRKKTLVVPARLIIAVTIASHAVHLGSTGSAITQAA